LVYYDARRFCAEMAGLLSAITALSSFAGVVHRGHFGNGRAVLGKIEFQARVHDAGPVAGVGLALIVNAGWIAFWATGFGA
jgi:hypothetical protein